MKASYLYNFMLLALLSGPLIFASKILFTNFSMGASVSSMLETVSPVEEFGIKSTSGSPTQNLFPEDFQNLVRSQISLVFSEMLSEIDQRYTSPELGLQYYFPNEWKET